MAEDMTFLPRSDILSLEEIADLAEALIKRGVTRIRLTGGEPLVRRGAVDVARRIGSWLGKGLDELTLTTNATYLAEHAVGLWDAGIRRINVSLDTRDARQFSYISRKGDLTRVLEGIAAAKAQGFTIKINMVALNGINDTGIIPMLQWCADEGFDLSLIETMPLGEIDDDRTNRFYPLTAAKDRVETLYTLVASTHRTGGPARYWNVQELGIKLGLISPLTQNFCASCNRVRVSASGKLYMCLGDENSVDLKAAMRSGEVDAFDRALNTAMGLKPEQHHFDLHNAATLRHMNVTGG
jgi:GTP 3',8-cyclase